MPWRTAIAREFFPAPPPQALEEAPVWRDLNQCNDVEILKALQEFGSLMMAESQARTALLDSKAISLLGWNAAGAAVFLAALPNVMPGSAERWFMVIGGIASMVGSILAFLALRVRGAPVPSQLEWLDVERCDDERRIRRSHLLTLKRWHEADGAINRTKGFFAKNAQWCLVIVASTLALSLLLALFPR